MKYLAALLVVTLLTLRLGSFCDEVFVTPVQDNLFGVTFIAAETDGEGRPPLSLKGAASLVWVVEPVTEVHVVLLESLFQPSAPQGLQLQLFPVDIFIPPESLHTVFSA